MVFDGAGAFVEPPIIDRGGAGAFAVGQVENGGALRHPPGLTAGVGAKCPETEEIGEVIGAASDGAGAFVEIPIIDWAGAEAIAAGQAEISGALGHVFGLTAGAGKEGLETEVTGAVTGATFLSIFLSLLTFACSIASLTT